MSGGVARIGLGLVGAGVGFLVGGPAGAFYGASIGFSAGGLLFPEQQRLEGPRLSDLKIQTSTYGAAIPIVYGAFQLAGNVIWLENNQLKETKHKKSGGGKGGPSQTQTNYTYSATFAVGLCEGPIFGVRRIWADTVLIYDADAPTADAGDPDAKSIIASAMDGLLRVFTKDAGGPGITVYKGTPDQLPHPRIEADRTTAPAYRSLAYVVVEDLQLEKFGNRIPNIRAEVIVAGVAGEIPWNVYTWDSPVPAFGTNKDILSIKFDSGVLVCQDFTADARLTYRYLLDGTLVSKDTQMLPPGVQIIGMVQNNPELAIVEVSGSSSNWCFMRKNGSIGNKIETLSGGFSSPISLYGCIWHEGRIVASGPTEGGKVKPVAYLEEGGYPIGLSTDISGDSIGFTVSDKGELFCKVSDGSGSKICKLNDDLNLEKTWPLLGWGGVEGAGWEPFTVYGDYLIAVAYDSGEGLFRLNEDGTITLLKSGIYGDATPILGTPLFVYNKGVSDIVGTIWSMSQTISKEQSSLSSVLGDLCSRAGLPVTDFDTSALTETVRGYAMTRPSPLRSLISQLRPAFRFDVAEIDYKLKFIPRGGDLAATLTAELTADDLAAHEPGQTRPAAVEHTRTLETELPRQVSLRYLDADMDYEQGVQYATRLVTEAVNDRVIDLPVVFSADEAAQAVDSVLAEAWLGRDTYRLQLAMPWAKLTPGDVIDVPLAAGTARVRIVQIDDGKPGLRLLEAAAESAAIYQSAAVGQAGESPTVTLSVPGPTVLALLDVPLLRDQDDTAGIYLAAAGYLESWSGAVLYRSADGGNSYTTVDPPLLTAATMGTTTDTLGDADPAVWDRGNTVNVRPLQGEELESVTEDAVLNGANAIAIGADGRWEIAAFRDAVLEADGSYTLSHFLRGLRGTEWAVSKHAVGDTLVLLTANGSVQRLGLALDTIGMDRLYKAVSIGNSLTQAAVQPFTFQAVSQKPLSVVHVKGRRNGAGDLSISWIRRTRVGGEWRDYTDAPLGEASEAYEVDILSGSTVKRTLSITSPSATYMAAQQTTDFGSAQAAIHLKIYPISAAVGRGYAAEATL